MATARLANKPKRPRKPDKTNAKQFVVRITRSGQITLPAEVRTFLGVKARDEVEYVIANDGTVTIVPVRDTLASLSGILEPPYPGFDIDRAIESAKEEMAQSVVERS